MNIFKGKFPVVYGQFYLYTDSHEGPALEDCFIGQENGLCGTACPNIIFFITGLHTGNIHLDVNVLKSSPGLDDQFSEIVEASFSLDDTSLSLNDWNGDISIPLQLPPGEYRVRYSAFDFGKAEETNQLEEGDVEFYKVDIWPAQTQGDVIIKVTSEEAKYWHSEAKKLRVTQSKLDR